MKVIELKRAELNPNPHQVEAKKLYDTENALVVHIMLKPGFYDTARYKMGEDV